MHRLETSVSSTPRPTLGLAAQLTRRRPIDVPLTDGSQPALRRSLGLWQLTMISIGATLGTGVFVVLGTAVPMAGPAVWIAFIVAGITAMLSALSYAEMAGSVPVSGSSYSYAYATLGEGLAWVCGWCLILEYAVSVAAVAVGAGEYVNDALGVFGLELPRELVAGPDAGGIVNLPAAALVLIAMFLLVRGTSESITVNTIMVILKIATMLLFIVIAFTAFQAGNLEPLAPMGTAGIAAAASRLFFSYIGFDAASTAGEEALNPRRDLPRAILLSLGIVTVIYILVAIAALGAHPWTEFTENGPTLAAILDEITHTPWITLVMAIGAVIAIASVVLTVLYGQTRILMSMSRDGMVPRVFQRISAKSHTPVAGTLIIGIAVAITAALIPLGELADATSIGTLFAFALVNLAVIYLRRTRPTAPRAFRVPLYPVVPILGFLCCVGLMVSLGSNTWIVFVIWMIIGVIWYLVYSRSHSVVGALSADEYEQAHAAGLAHAERLAREDDNPNAESERDSRS
ncbi:amino acid permease [Mycetocola lacteus]|uniref:Amino acid permease n=1 Tax=Mycetocola lacteus TaxID=76637 RepID=A0A3L7ASD8_9MICO|nr:amino acid permease [Mycetocola lacteus]